MENRAYSYKNLFKDPLEAFFEGFDELEIRQEIQSAAGDSAFKSWVKYTSYETPHKYIVSRNREEIGEITEQIDGWIPFSLKNSILQNRRPARFIAQNQDGDIIFRLYRPFSFLFSKMIVKDAKERPLGFVRQTVSFFSYELFAKGPQPFASINSPAIREAWTVPVLSGKKRPIGAITKKWRGVKKEFSSYADAFSIKWGHLSLEQKAVLLAAVISIDFDFFE